MSENNIGNYKTTDYYKNADKEVKRKIESYKKENKISEKHLYLLLEREGLRNLPKQEKARGNSLAEMIVVGGIISFLIVTASKRYEILPYVSVYVIITTIIYLTGILNPISRKLNNINKVLKKFPKVPPIKDYLGNKQ